MGSRRRTKEAFLVRYIFLALVTAGMVMLSSYLTLATLNALCPTEGQRDLKNALCPTKGERDLKRTGSLNSPLTKTV